MYAQRRLRSAWASAQSDQSLRCPHEESLCPSLPIEHTAKTLIKLGGYPGWSESSLSAKSISWFCHVAAHLCLTSYTMKGLQNSSPLLLPNLLYYQPHPSLAITNPVIDYCKKQRRPRGRAVSAPDFDLRGREFESRWRRDLPDPKRHFIAQSLSCSPFHRLEMTEILLKGRKTLTPPSIVKNFMKCQVKLFRSIKILVNW